jgi:hypothetical protein
VLRKRPAAGGSSNAPAPSNKRLKSRRSWLPSVELTGGMVRVDGMVRSCCRKHCKPRCKWLSAALNGFRAAAVWRSDLSCTGSDEHTTF